MALNTFEQIQNSRVVQVANSAPNSPEFASVVNEAVDELMRRGNWWGTTQPMQGCVYDGCVVWPRNVASVLAINSRCRHTSVANHWFQFMDWSREWHYGLYEDYRRRGRVAVSVNDGTLPVFNPIPCGQSRGVRFYIDNQLDAGKSIVIYGLDANNQPLVGVRSDGTTQDGWQITLARTPVQTLPVNKISRVVKDPTLGRVRGYQVDSNGVLYDMAFYQPSETSPDYVRTRVPANARFPMITALVKLAFIPVQYPDDLVPIENMEAIANMVYSIRKKEQGDIDEALKLDKLAIRSLNYEMRTRYPDEQFQVNFNPFGRNNDLNNWRTRIGMV
jgi:hypothetical protein